MKLRNKKTGIVELDIIGGQLFFKRLDKKTDKMSFNSLAELNEEWEDYQEPIGWGITMYGGISRITKDDEPLIADLKEIGNYFCDKEAAYDALAKLKAFKRLKDKGISFEAKVIDGRWYLGPKVEPKQRTFDEVNDLFKDAMFIFGGEE